MTTKPTDTKPASFLLVEDDDDHANMIMLALRKARPNDTITHVTDGEAALDHLRNTDERPSVILLDLNLPKVSGHEVLEQVKSNPYLCHIPVVVLTTSKAEADRARAYAAHANSYIAKPLGFKNFSTLVAEVGQYWAEMNQPAPAA